MTHIGRRRDMNQDYMYTSTTPVGSLPNLFVVADGMGGHAAGDVAAKTAIDTLKEKLTDFSAKATASCCLKFVALHIVSNFRAFV